MSGLRPNVGKSVVMVDGVSPLIGDCIRDMLGFTVGSFPMTYLGFPLHPKKISMFGCSGLILRLKELVDN